MIVVSNASPLITLGKLGRLSLLQELFGELHVASDVFAEVVTAGPQKPAAEAVAVGSWRGNRKKGDRGTTDHEITSGRMGLPHFETWNIPNKLFLEQSRYQLLARSGPGAIAKSHLLPGLEVAVDTVFGNVTGGV